MKDATAQCFVVTDELFNAANWDDILATIAALKECKVFSLPYPVINIRCSFLHPSLDITGKFLESSAMGNICYDQDPSGFFEYRNVRMLPNGEFEAEQWAYIKGRYMNTEKFFNIARGGKSYEETIAGAKLKAEREGIAIRIPSKQSWEAPHVQQIGATARWTIFLLLAYLSARGMVKSTVHCKTAKLGMGKANPEKRYSYTTTLSLPSRGLETDQEHIGTGRELSPHLRRAHVRRQHHGPGNLQVKLVLIEAVIVNADKKWIRSRSCYVAAPNNTVH